MRDALSLYDLIVFLGADQLRMSVYSPVEPLPAGLPVVHVSERARELGKNYRTDLALQANVKETLRALLPLVRARSTPQAAGQAAERLAALKPRNWSASRAKAAVEAMAEAETTPIDPRYLMLRISEHLPKDAVVVEEALTSSVSLPGFLRESRLLSLQRTGVVS